MANPRAGSKAKAHSMAIQVTKPVAGASTLAHSTRGSRVLGSSQLLAVPRFITGNMIGPSA